MAHYNIVNGPSINYLALWVLEPLVPIGQGGFAPRQLTFVLEHSHRDVCVTGIKMEDGSGKRWLIDGFVTSQPGNVKFHAYFDFDSRKGWIKHD